MTKKSTLVFPVDEKTVRLATKKRKVGKAKLNGWGGKFEPQDGDSARACVCREFRKESGAILYSGTLKKVAVIDFYRGGKHIFECHVYFVEKKYVGGTMVETEEMGNPIDFPRTAIPYDQMMAGDAKWLSLLLEGRCFTAKVYYAEDNETLLDFQIIREWASVA